MLRAALVVAVLVGLDAGVQAAECKNTSTAKGKKLFTDNCGYCHGADAKGQGTMEGKLDQAVHDLTLLSKANGGKFPEKAVRDVVDGRDVPEHISNDMPSWGITFHVTADTEAEVQQRICDLVAYLRSIQE